jgi:hypothetical protein
MLIMHEKCKQMPDKSMVTTTKQENQTNLVPDNFLGMQKFLTINDIHHSSR